jgi:hypothetical protein
MIASFRKRKAFIFVAFFIFFSAFTSDILALRKDFHVLFCPDATLSNLDSHEQLPLLVRPHSSLDNNILISIVSDVAFDAEQNLMRCPAHWKSASVEISFMHLLSYGFRAPPSWS